MADIRAFRAFRYDLGRVDSLSKVVSPPYDVINSELQGWLVNRSPHNAVRIEFPPEEHDDNDTENKYARAARTIKEWVAEDVLKQDTARGLYVYEQEFEAEDQKYVRRGFFARVRLEPSTTGRIYPHEQTLSAPKEDRIKLYRSTGFNLSPVFSLYPDADNEVAKILEPFTINQPPLEAKDHNGVINRLWLVADQQAISAVVGKMGPKPLYIADGHHRYETGLRYLEERKAAGEVPNDEAAPNFCLMMLVSTSDPGLVLLPTHRLVSGLTSPNMAELRESLKSHFDVIAETDSAAKTWAFIEKDGSQSLLGFGTACDGKWIVGKLRDPSIMEKLAPDLSADCRGLGVTILHKLVLDQLLQDESGTPDCRYVHQLQDVTAAADGNECSIVVLVPRVTINMMERIAGNREKMPPKTTYFYPKVITGMVFNSLKKD